MQALKTRLERERMIAESWSRKLVWEAPGLLEVPSDNGEGIHCDVKLGVNHQLLSGVLKLDHLDKGVVLGQPVGVDGDIKEGRRLPVAAVGDGHPALPHGSL